MVELEHSCICVYSVGAVHTSGHICTCMCVCIYSERVHYVYYVCVYILYGAVCTHKCTYMYIHTCASKICELFRTLPYSVVLHV